MYIYIFVTVATTTPRSDVSDANIENTMATNNLRSFK